MQKPLFRVRQHINLYSRPKLDLFGNHDGIFSLPDRTRTVCFVIVNLIGFHDRCKIRKHIAQLIHMVRVDYTVLVCVRSEFNGMPDTVYFFHAYLM